ncbi:hypothetical protein BH24ACI5_BH24ACI5_10220 [soil metagenome]
MPARRRVKTLGTLLLIVAASQGCALLGWNCRRGQKTGDVTTITGRVEAGQLVSHLVPYDQQGTQNDVRISWPGQSGTDAPRLRVYATSASCQEFTAPPVDTFTPGTPSTDRRTVPRGPAPQPRPGSEADPCVVMSGRQFMFTSTGELVQDGLVVAGGPEQLKPDLHEYKLHVVGDQRLPVTYSISVTWFRGPDC